MDLRKENLNRFFTCIEYPGIVKNENKALDTLGGINEISKVCSKTNRRLELRFRPEDVYCKPACGDRYKTNGIILKIRVVKGTSENGEETRVIKKCEIVGRVTQSFKFKSICDFQYLPMMKMPDGHMENITESLLPRRVDGEHLKNWIESPASYFLPPVAFSRIDTQSLNTYMFRKDIKDKYDKGGGSPLIGRTRKRRSGHAVFVSFDIPKIPSKPRDKAIKFLEVKFLNGQQLEQIKQCFQERPVWSKLALKCVTSFHYDQLKYLLPAVAYYFVTGPFRVMWVRFGYDPRKDPNSRIYQTLDYRIRAPGLLSFVKAKRNDSNYLLPSKSSHSVAKSVVITKDVEAIEQSDVPEERIKKDSHIYQPNCLPPARQMFYQYCDVKVPEIEAMLGRLPKAVPNAECDPKHGWLPSGFDNQCRDIINIYVTKQLNRESSLVGSGSYNEEEPGADDSTDNESRWEEEFDEEEVDNESDEV